MRAVGSGRYRWAIRFPYSIILARAGVPILAKRLRLAMPKRKTALSSPPVLSMELCIKGHKLPHFMPVHMQRMDGQTVISMSTKAVWLRQFLTGSSKGAEEMNVVQAFVDKVSEQLANDGHSSKDSRAAHSQQNVARDALLHSESDQSDREESPPGDSPKDRKGRGGGSYKRKGFSSVTVDGMTFQSAKTRGLGILLPADPGTLEPILAHLVEAAASDSLPQKRTRHSLEASGQALPDGASHKTCLSSADSGRVKWSFRYGGGFNVTWVDELGTQHSETKAFKVPIHGLDGKVLAPGAAKVNADSVLARARHFWNETDRSARERFLLP